MGIRDYIIRNIGLDEGSKLPFSIELITAAKNKILTDYNQHENSVYFIRSGVVISSITYKDEERILDFHFPRTFCASYSSLLTRETSDTRLLCYENCELEVVNYKELQAVYKTSLLANQLGRVATEQLFLSRVQREKELLTMNAEQRYQSLLNRNPALVQTIPVKELSKYLGVRPESLSRIRRG